MPRPAASLLVLALGAALLLAAGGCGEEDAELLPGETAREITANLDTVQQLADEGDCLGAESAAEQVGEQVEALSGVDPRLKRALVDGTDRLEEVLARCQEEVEAAEPDVGEVELPDEEAEDEKDREREEAEEEKEEERRAKEEEKEEAEEEREGGEFSPTAPPRSEGEGNGVEGESGSGGGPSSGEGGPPSSGGVSSANPAGGGE